MHLLDRLTNSAANDTSADRALNDTPYTPTGWRILVEIPEKKEQTRGGIFLPEQAKRDEEIASLCGRVLQLGPLCYQDEAKFGFDSEAWCKPGDYVLMAAYSGTRLKVPGTSRELRLINDDAVIGTASSPDDVERA